MADILVFTENVKGKLKRSSLELLTAAKKSGRGFAAVVFGSHADAIQQCSAYGPEKVFSFDGVLDDYNPEIFSRLAADLIAETNARTVLASASAQGRDLFPRVAARLKTGLLSDCVSVDLSGSEVRARRPLYAGKCFADMAFQNSRHQIVLMRPNQLPVENAAGGSSSVDKKSVPAMDLKTLVKSVVKGTSEKLDLTEANVIVSGGRGLKEASNFKMLHDLAEVLGATVGASRAVVDAGWVGHDMQVGQTGKTVAPNLYIAVGISGAIQHLAGMSGSKVIVAVNSDAAAPIFQKATYGLVGDLFQIVPAMTEEFKKLLHH